MKINTLIIDDDPNWLETLSEYVAMVPTLNLVGCCSSALEAYALLTDNQIDLLLCDIEMPNLSGLDFVRRLKSPPLVIFVTSYPRYALDCYEVSPIDFLLKPLEPGRFIQSIERVKQRLLAAPESLLITPHFFIRDNNDYIQIPYHEVLYIKAKDRCSHVVTNQKTYSTLAPLNKIEEQLKDDLFLRVHRSYLVHRSAIAVIARNEMTMTNGETIPLGDQYRGQINRLHIAEKLIN